MSVGTRSLIGCAVLLTWPIACGGRLVDDSFGTTQSAVAVLDGANNGGNPHFFFLPPMVSAPTYSGDFDATLGPEVDICATAEVMANGGCDAVVAQFSMNQGVASEIIRVEPASEQYIVNWHTDESNLISGDTYHIAVRVGSAVLGYANLQAVDTGKEMKNVDTSEYIALKDGRTLPIKFRIEAGALPTEARTISGGRLHTCALSSGAAHCWGNNDYGQVGNGFSGASVAVPTPVVDGHTFTTLVTGRYHSCGLDLLGQAWCWGQGDTGALGHGATALVQPTPVQVVGGHTFVSLTSKGHHTCALDQSGAAWCWGLNTNGQLGTGSVSPAYADEPVSAAVGHTFQSLGGGAFFTCGVEQDGTAWCWGNNEHGEAGIGEVAYDAPFAVLTPQQVVGGHSFVSIHVGFFASCGITDTGAAHCWGYNYFGGLGAGFRTTDWLVDHYSESSPLAVVGGLAFSMLAPGFGHTCGLTTSNGAFCWGFDLYGQVGTGTVTAAYPYSVLTPQAVMGGGSFAALDTGYDHSCAITLLGEGQCWGADGQGQLGDGTISPADPTPHPVDGTLIFDTP